MLKKEFAMEFRYFSGFTDAVKDHKTQWSIPGIWVT